jgi:hypothetical protein
MHGHGVETEVRPRLKRTTSSDGFQWFISWNPAFAGDHISQITVDLVATLGDSRFRFEDDSGRVLELRPSSVNGVFGAMGLLFVMSPEGLELREGSLDSIGGPADPLKLPWEGGNRAELNRPGPWRVQMVGNLHFFNRGPLPFESSWVSFHQEPSSSTVLPLADVPRRAREILERQIGPEDPPASFRGLPGENEAGNRVVIFDRGGVDERWVMRTSLVELSPAGDLAALWRDERHTCVAEGTMIETRRGTVPVEQISIGDSVLSYDTRASVHVWSPVRSVRAGQASEVLLIDGKLELTDKHPLWIDGAWREARHLRKGSELMRMDGKLESVASVVAKPGEVAVYDLSVDDPHNYFADGFLVHNKSILRPSGSTWIYNPAIHRPQALLEVIGTAHQPTMECLASFRRTGLESFIIEFQGGHARLIVLRPKSIGERQSATGADLSTGTVVEGCLDPVFEDLAEKNAYPRGVQTRFYRFRVEGDGPPVVQVAELEVDTMRDGFTARGPSVAQCLVELAKRRESLAGSLKRGSEVTLEVNFRAPFDAVTVINLYDPRGIPVDGFGQSDAYQLNACLEAAVHPSWFDGVPPTCETTIRSTYRLTKTKGSWDAAWELDDVGPSDGEVSVYRCTSARPGLIKLRRALDADVGGKKTSPATTPKLGPLPQKQCKSTGGYTSVWASPSHELRCGPSCDEVRECRFVGWSRRDMSFECGLYARIEVGLNSHSSFVERTPLPTGFPVRIRLVERDDERWLTVRAAETRDGYNEGEIILASGDASTVTPPGEPGFFAPLDVQGSATSSGGHVVFTDRFQWTRIDHNADCHTADGNYFIAVAHARDPRPTHAAKRFDFVVMSARRR